MTLLPQPGGFEGLGLGPILPNLHRFAVEQFADMRLDEVDLVTAPAEATTQPRNDDDRVAAPSIISSTSTNEVQRELGVSDPPG